jgi:ribokinase
VVVGSVNVDLVVTLPRIPGPGETVGGGTFARHHGGKGGNKASAVARLGVDCRLVACVGDDDEGRSALAALRADGVDCGDVGVVGAHTGIASILVDAGGDNLIALAAGANAVLTADLARDAARRLLGAGDVLLADLEVPLESVCAAAEVAREVGAVVVLDPAPAMPLPPGLLRQCAVLTPNQHEVGLLADAPGRPDDGDDTDGAAATGVRRLLEAGVGAVVVTRGAAGCDVYTQGVPPWHHPAVAVDVVDTTGAGDAFAAGLAAALARGEGLDRAVHAGTAAGAATAAAAGARGGHLTPMAGPRQDREK